MNGILSALASGVISVMWKLYEKKKADTSASAASKIHALEEIARKQKDLIDKARIFCNYADGKMKADAAEIARLNALVANLTAHPVSSPHPIDQNPY